MFRKQPVGQSSCVRVTFELPSALWAERVNLVGDFNDWDTAATPLIRDRTHDDWRATLELPLGQRYHFRYLLNGEEWLNEWHADDYEEADDGLYSSVVDLVKVKNPSGKRALPHQAGARPIMTDGGKPTVAGWSMCPASGHGGRSGMKTTYNRLKQATHCPTRKEGAEWNNE